MTDAIYRGYSSVITRGPDTGVYDMDLVIQDILNELNTRLGERVGRPNFGSIIWTLLFDLSDTRTETAVVQDVQRIIGKEPRVKLIELIPNISHDEHRISVRIRVRGIEIDMDQWFTAVFQQ